jgi:hypothetical protein
MRGESGPRSDLNASGQEALGYLGRTNLFIVPLEDESRWYRYHYFTIRSLLMNIIERGTARLAGALPAVALCLILLFTASCASTHVTARIPGEKAVSSLEYIELGGARQLTLIRGEDVSKPILLFIHGGPGVPFIPFERTLRGRKQTMAMAQ